MTEFVPSDVISRFIEGRDPQKYIVGVEGEYFTTDIKLIINDPNRGKKHIETKSLKPFIYCKPEAFKYLYGGNRLNFKRAMREFGVKWKKLITTDANGFEPDRLTNGFTYMFYTNNPYQKLLSFFKEGGLDVFKCADSIKKIMGIPLKNALPPEIDSKLFMTLSPVEQYMVQSGKRLFKGFDSYDDLHRMHFDIETSGLDPKRDRIFQIGIKTNKGFEKVLEVKGDTKKEERMLERKVITNFFQIIDYFKPDIIAGYNSEFFDWDFILQRAEILGLDIKEIAKTLNKDKKLTRRDSTVKFGADTEHYQQTNMWGYSIIDIAHSVRKAQAINSEIKSWSLKYITKFQGANKPNRVYVPGDKIFTTWHDDENKYAFNETNGDYYKINEDRGLEDGYEEKTGAFIVERYLIDDLWETEKVDFEFNQAAFLLAKLVPASYMRSTTMGTAALWKTIMLAWSYENNLAIPNYETKREFTGGLSRLLETGYAKDVVKLDYAALYPNIELTHDIFPDLDISGVMKGMLLYIAETRDKYKALKNEYGAKGDKAMSNFYDTQQLPLKILANSFFGSFGAPYIFPWGDIACAEETTCRGRQYLRLMVKHFTENYGFRVLVLDTDGANFAIPETVNEIKYLVKGNHRLTMKKAGETLTGVDAVVADFNEKYMIGRMGLDIDDICTSTINFKRKNYANNILKGYDDNNDPKIKLKIVGNTVKSKSLPTYLEEFMDKGIRLLLDGNGYEFIELYYEYIDKLYNYKIPIAKLASKSKVKKTNSQYIEDCKKVNIAGNPMPRQAHMELILVNNLTPGLGDVIYYYNTGTSKSHGDLKTVTDKKTGEKSIQLNCKMISEEDLEKNPDLLVEDYNLPRYISAFNKRISGLLVCFSKEIRDRIIIDVKKDRKTKEYMLEEREFFSEEQCKLVAGEPLDEGDQDTYEALMTMEDKELKFWTSVNKLPNSTTAKQWAEEKAKYLDLEPDYNEFEDEVLIVDDGVPQNVEVDNNQTLHTPPEQVIPIEEAIPPMAMNKPNGIGLLNAMDVVNSINEEELSYLEIVEIEKTGIIPDKYNMLSMEQILKYKSSALERHISNLSN